ncbi:hypothetical protein V496_03781 [Pseudogymnoascus sp. VKM F-4515 (FW-2607)]|nr:hypothetical protein V496_03781 [Pseudogymnoascus sp. VKM F-4515 (FW-2607)]KFY82397.1 hypothetical protein V498_08598 [Pseudogymnoascus sp. VKM F-4517 (FW-2822)]
MCPLLPTERGAHSWPARYTEAMPYLYASNTFAMRNARTILRIPSLLPPKHLHAIRSVLLTAAIGLGNRHGQPAYVLKKAAEANPDRLEVVWAEAWRILAGMQALVELHVVLQPVNGGGNFLMRESYEVALEPVEKMGDGGGVFTSSS